MDGVILDFNTHLKEETPKEQLAYSKGVWKLSSGEKSIDGIIWHKLDKKSIYDKDLTISEYMELRRKQTY